MKNRFTTYDQQPNRFLEKDCKTKQFTLEEVTAVQSEFGLTVKETEEALKQLGKIYVNTEEFENDCTKVEMLDGSKIIIGNINL